MFCENSFGWDKFEAKRIFLTLTSFQQVLFQKKLGVFGVETFVKWKYVGNEKFGCKNLNILLNSFWLSWITQSYSFDDHEFFWTSRNTD